MIPAHRDDADRFVGWDGHIFSALGMRDHADDVLAELRRRLSLGSPNLGARDIPERTILECVVQSLSHDFYAEINGLCTDQWSGVLIEGSGPHGDEAYRTWVECDDMLVGVAASWFQWARRFGYPDEWPRGHLEGSGTDAPSAWVEAARLIPRVPYQAQGYTTCEHLAPVSGNQHTVRVRVNCAVCAERQP